ncbi:MAG TPA: AtpZ/AtpI family protein, partial [Planctomycetota bacterium]|nr:AtpZ/AtpI family protein [Planctomycetota bacterium]
MAETPRKPAKSVPAFGAGITFAVTVALFTLGGWWVDGKLGSTPLFVLIGVFLG